VPGSLGDGSLRPYSQFSRPMTYIYIFLYIKIYEDWFRHSDVMRARGTQRLKNRMAISYNYFHFFGIRKVW
jgi:hypothetical protein